MSALTIPWLLQAREVKKILKVWPVLDIATTMDIELVRAHEGIAGDLHRRFAVCLCPLLVLTLVIIRESATVLGDEGFEFGTLGFPVFPAPLRS